MITFVVCRLVVSPNNSDADGYIHRYNHLEEDIPTGKIVVSGLVKNQSSKDGATCS